MVDGLPASEPVPPSFFRRFLVRLVFAYWVLFNLPFPFGVLPGTEVVAEVYAKGWEWVVERLGKFVFGLAITFQPSGSGDTTFNYVQLLLLLVLAGLVALVWTWRGRPTALPRRWDEALRIYVRFSLATTMILYGVFKVIPSQFPAPSWDRLYEPFGEASPMGLLWTFMGASVAYNVFAGAAEVLGGVLLAFRRTTLLGALVSAAVMSNVVALNFCYDVPVKLYSSHLLLMALFLAGPDLPRLVSLFWFHREVPARAPESPFGKPWQRRAARVAALLVVAAAAATAGSQALEGRHARNGASPSPLRGIWSVEEFTTDGIVRPPLVTDEKRWRRLIIERSSFVSIQQMNDQRVRRALKVDPEAKTVALGTDESPEGVSTLTYSEPEPGVVVLDGKLDGQELHAKLRRLATPEFLLTTRGFHWVNEFPFNR